jgi:translation initiation factor 2 gamma subunit (eIF-2gamma)
VDCPGHDILMATMLNGAAVMDAALLLIAGECWREGVGQGGEKRHALTYTLKRKRIMPTTTNIRTFGSY